MPAHNVRRSDNSDAAIEFIARQVTTEGWSDAMDLVLQRQDALLEKPLDAGKLLRHVIFSENDNECCVVVACTCLLSRCDNEAQALASPRSHYPSVR